MRHIRQVRAGPLPAGVTLIELMVSTAVVALLATAALPSFDGFLQRREMAGLSGRLVADLQSLRSNALARQEPLRLSLYPPANGRGGCYALHTGAATACQCNGGTLQCTGAELLGGMALSPDGRVTLRANVSSLRLDPRQGTVSPTGSIEIVGRDGQSLKHVINLMGRVRLCSAVGSWPGVSAC